MPFTPDRPTSGFVPDSGPLAPVKKSGGVGGIARFLGIEKAGQGTATAIRNVKGQTAQSGQDAFNALQDSNKLIQAAKKYPQGSPQRTRLLRAAAGLPAPVQESEIDPGVNLSTKEVAGSFGNVALNIGAAGLKGPTAAKPLARIAQTTAKTGALGTAFGVAQGLTEDESAGQIAKRAATSGAISAGLGFGIQGIAEIGKYLTSPQVTTKIMDRTLKIPKKIIEKGRSPSRELVEQGVIGTKRGILHKSEQTITAAEKEIDDVLKGNIERYRGSELLTQIRQEMRKIYSGALNEAEVNRIVDKQWLNLSA